MLTAAGQWHPKRRRVKQVHVWRQRRSCRGELVQWDTSVHAWLEGRGPAKMYLIALIDDATGTLFARFVPADSTEHHMRVLAGVYFVTRLKENAVFTVETEFAIPGNGNIRAVAPPWSAVAPPFENSKRTLVCCSPASTNPRSANTFPILQALQPSNSPGDLSDPANQLNLFAL